MRWPWPTGKGGGAVAPKTNKQSVLAAMNSSLMKREGSLSEKLHRRNFVEIRRAVSEVNCG